MQPVPWVWTVSMRAGGEDFLPVVGYQNIGDGFTFHVPALDQHGLGAVAEDQVGGVAHVVDIEDFQSAQHLGFRNVGREDLRQRQQPALKRMAGVRVEQRGPTLGDHDGIDHQRDVDPHLLKHIGDRVDHIGAVQHAGLDRVGADVFQHKAHLLER